MRDTWRAIATLVGTTIGAGMFGIPFVVSKIGFLPGMIYLLILGLLNLLLNLVYGEIILRTPGDHQLTGYGKIYLGEKGMILATLGLFVSLYGALLAYLIKIGEFLMLITEQGNPIFFSFLFFVLATTAIFFGLKAVSFLQGFLFLFRLALIFLIVIFGLEKINLINFSGVDFSFLFLPYGVLLFAFAGAAVIPEMEEILRKEPKELKKAIVIGSLIPLFVYILFAFAIVGITGSLTSDDAISGLVMFLPAWIVLLGAILGILSMVSPYLILGYVLREVWYRDFKFPKLAAFLLACFPSLILFLLGAKSFIGVLGITGAVAGGLTGLLIVAIFKKAKNTGKRKPIYCLNLPKMLIWLLYAIFFLGMLSPFLGKLIKIKL